MLDCAGPRSQLWLGSTFTLMKVTQQSPARIVYFHNLVLLEALAGSSGPCSFTDSLGTGILPGPLPIRVRAGACGQGCTKS
jgi:hypothetical protein